jgi:hypothetical protein
MPMTKTNRPLCPPLASKPGTLRIFLPPASVVPWYQALVCDQMPVIPVPVPIPAPVVPIPAHFAPYRAPRRTAPRAPRAVVPASTTTPLNNTSQWVREQYSSGSNPRQIRDKCVAMGCPLPKGATRWTIGTVIALLVVTPSKGRRRSWTTAPVQDGRITRTPVQPQ